MNDSLAASKADQYLLALITHQPSFWPSGAMSSAANAETLATNLATLRKRLVDELKKQPD